MANLYDLAYALAVAVGAPYWLIKPSTRRKVLGALRDRRGQLPALPDAPTVLIHAVSVGEVNSTPALVHQLRQRRPALRFVITTTTQTGLDRSRQLYDGQPDVTLARFPLDFTGSIARLLDSARPIIVVLMELEVWPNFMRQCERRRIPVVVVNGRVTEPALRRYLWAGPVTRRMFRRLSAAAVQDETYATRFERLGVPRERIGVLGTMKFDSATVADRIDGAEELREQVGLAAGEPVWVCGSTGPGEESIVLRAYRALLADHPGLRLVIVPRHPPRFDEVADLIRRDGFELIRRSASHSSISDPQPATRNPQLVMRTSPPPIILGDTMGELRRFYSLADVVFVGRSLVDLGPRQAGSDMIEPSALARAVIVGPHTGNFDMPMRRLRAADAIVEVRDGSELAAAVNRLLRDETARRALGQRAQQTIHSAQGSTARHAELILRLSDAPSEPVRFR